MPIYRGTQKVAAVYRGGQSVKSVYRGDTEVWSVGPTWPPFFVSGNFNRTSLNRYFWGELARVVVPDQGGLYRATMTVTWESNFPSGQMISYANSTNTSPGFGISSYTWEASPYMFTFGAFSNSATNSQRTVTGGSYSVERIG